MLSASVATLDRLLKPVRATVAGRRKLRRRLSPGRNIPVGTFADWNRPPPVFLEIDLFQQAPLLSLITSRSDPKFQRTLPFFSDNG